MIICFRSFNASLRTQKLDLSQPAIMLRQRQRYDRSEQTRFPSLTLRNHPLILRLISRKGIISLVQMLLIERIRLGGTRARTTLQCLHLLEVGLLPTYSRCFAKRRVSFSCGLYHTYETYRCALHPCPYVSLEPSIWLFYARCICHEIEPCSKQ